MSTPSSASITAGSGSNFTAAFAILPARKRRAMSIFYAFCRVVDDIADSTTLSLDEKKSELTEWHEEIRKIESGEPHLPLAQELAEIAREFHIPSSVLEEIVLGVEMDLTADRYPDFASLKKYCYRVASAVGLASICIFEYKNKQTEEYAVALGMAFQLTNILRDVKKDASFGRIYIPSDELKMWNVTEDDILQSRWSPAMKQLLRFQYHRAEHYFAKSLRLLAPEDRPNLLAAEMMRGVYHRILERIAERDFNVFTGETRLNKLGKVVQILKAYAREKKAAPLPPAPKKVLVLGGGYAGLSAAFELIRRGHDVTLLEARGFLGGRAQSFVEPKTGETIDNGQHVLMGCYHETLKLVKKLGTEDRLLVPKALDVPYLSAKGRSFLRAPSLPAPFHLLFALTNFQELGWTDRLAAANLTIRFRLGQKPNTRETVKEWLQRWKQPANIIRAVWEPLCLAALNESIDTASASVFAVVIKRALLGSAQDSQIIISRVGLSDLFAPELEKLMTMCESSIKRNQVISELKFEGDRIAEVKVQNGESYKADYVISALPWNALRGLLPAQNPLATTCRELGEAAIVSLHFWFDRPIMAENFIGFLDSPLHWIFNRNRIENKSSSSLSRYSLIISGAASLTDASAIDLEAMALNELHRFLPASREAEIKHRLIYKSRSATFATTPAVEKLRPSPKTEWKNFWLAGDWTQTGLPATLEGAILSGERAAKLVDQRDN